MTTTIQISTLPSFVKGAWVSGRGEGLLVRDATTGKPVARISAEEIDLVGALQYAREVGNPAVRRLSFHERARRLKALAQHLLAHKDALYDLSYATGATKGDAWLDVDGGIGVLFSYSSLVRRELPDETFLVEDETIPLAKDGTFAARHLLSPKEGVAVHINAFNFPCWGMLEKFAPTFLAGMPAVVKPAPESAHVAEAMVRQIVASGLVPDGALQLISGDAVDFFSHLLEQDVVSFTGSAATGRKLRAHPNVLERSIPFIMENDSLNCAVLGQTVTEGDLEFELFVKEVAREITTKAGQRCTAVRRILVPKEKVEAVAEALKARLQKTTLGNPREEGVRMGPLISLEQREEVLARLRELESSCQVIYQGTLEPVGADPDQGAFCAPTLLYCARPLASHEPHTVEAFGPVSTLLPYESLDEAVEIARLGRGSLVSSVVSADAREVRELTLGLAPLHGRILILNRFDAQSSTGHGSPLPLLSHGGPGRAGGSEELGGVRSIKHYMQRTAVQADPNMLMAVTGEYAPGAETFEDAVHPFRKTFDELRIGESHTTHRRTVTEADIVNFANVSGDYFYAHVDEVAAPDSIFEKRVAHGYFLVSAAAGLFVDPRPGPVLANYGLDNLRFTKPVGIGDTIQATLTVKRKIAKEKREGDKVASGVVVWDVQLANQHGELVARYDILTLVERKEDDAG